MERRGAIVTVAGHIYGVVLNDNAELEQLAPKFDAKPYAAPPIAPVVYLKPRSSIARGEIRIERGATVVAAPTLALLFSRDATGLDPETALDCVGAACLAIDVCYPRKDYYRPAVGQSNADGFLALGEWGYRDLPGRITSTIDGEPAHAWSLERLVRGPAELIADLSEFMTLRAGDVLLIGLPGDAPTIGPGQTMVASAGGLPEASLTISQAPR